jgi:glycosyltransferase A (GT-A) superfamily protein (DUF2064 family)
MLRERMVTLAEAALAPLELWATPHPHPFLRSLARRCGARLRVQPKGDLGGRMAAVLAGGDPCAIIGGDCAGLPASTVGDALAALDAGERVVISPARDGGYTMVAMRHPPRAMFQRMPWGRAVVMAETRRRLARSGIRPRELGLSWDVDGYADWRRWRRQRLAFGSCTRGPYC